VLLTLPWKDGAVPDAGAGCLVSATRTAIARWRDVLGIIVGGLRLRSRWAGNPGSVGMQIAMDLRRRESWSLSAWTTEEDLARFVRSDAHRRVLAPYRDRVTVRADRWEADRVDLSELWREARRRLAS
jgi:heme-degrading monooxygenase HmoA